MSKGDWSVEVDRLARDLRDCSSDFIENADIGAISDVAGDWFTDISVNKSETVLAALRAKRLLDRVCR